MERLEKRHKRNRKFLIAAACAFTGGVFAVYFAHFRGHISTDAANWAQFGEFVGGLLNPGLAMLALVALVESSGVQWEAIKASVAEMEKSRKRDEIFRIIQWTMERIDFQIEAQNDPALNRLSRGEMNPGDPEIEVLTRKSTALKGILPLLASLMDTALPQYEALDRSGTKEVGQLIRSRYEVLWSIIKKQRERGK